MKIKEFIYNYYCSSYPNEVDRLYSPSKVFTLHLDPKRDIKK